MKTRHLVLLTLVLVIAAAAPALRAQSGAVGATKDAPFINTLGMEFVPVPGTKVLFCRTETRVKDFEAYVKDTGGVFVMKVPKQKDGSYKLSWELDEKASWQKPGFEQGRSHPVVGVNWNEAREFCAWLSKKEGVQYRLPTDDEWSAAVGLGKYPWGSAWPPPKDAGNYGDKTFLKSLPGEGWSGSLAEYDDGAARTAPVASYAANRLCIFDLGGNVRQWCEDEYKASMNAPDVLKEYPVLEKEKASDGTAFRVLRGASWNGDAPLGLRSSCRGGGHPVGRTGLSGFRCVLVVSGR
jgi:formylglycine-generating enzyme required for sulfatase activity